MEPTKRVVIAGIATWLALLSACSPSLTWTEYVYKEHGFAVAFAQPPKAGTQQAAFITQATTDAYDMGVVVVCNPTSDKSSDQTLSDAVDAIRQQGTVRNLTYTASGPLVGREMLVDRPNVATVRERVFVRDKCLYQVYASAQGGPDDESVAHFLDSFRLLGG